MLFKNFRFQLVVRVILLNITILSIFWLILRSNYYITTLSLSLIAILEVILMIHYVERTNLMFVKFLNAIRYDDYTQTYTVKGLGRSFDNLNREFNQVVQKFQEVRADREAQYDYLNTIVQHIGIGLLVFGENGKIQLLNPTGKNLLGLSPQIKFIQHFPESHLDLAKYLNKPASAKRELIKLPTEEKILHLALRRTAIKLRGETFHIVSLQDIQSELEDKEMEAWQNLIRILTHEIINSVTPITSLAGTIDEDLHYHVQNLETNQREIGGEPHLVVPISQFRSELEEVHYAIKTIQRRSEGLIRFVKDFRSLTKIPMPNLQTIMLKELIDSVVFLQKEEFKKNQVQFQFIIQPLDLQVIADSQLIEQVLINLLKNATQALENSTEKNIKIQAYRDSSSKVLVEIADTGAGISDEAMKNIFIPFFTTKKTGSGIGLSFSRQVMRLHGGSITVQSKLGEGTTFTLKFP
jgi:two-component system, NtrC family, nitrogen regulation sensor histidine kinase NtrY